MKLAFGRFTFDSDTRELLDDGRRVHLSPKAFELLLLLLERRPAVVSKADIRGRVWADAFVGEASLSVVVAEIRQVLGEKSNEARYIRTVHRVGYAFCGAVSAADRAAPPRAGAFHRCWLTWNEQTFPLAEGENVVGRDPRCEVWIDGSGVSRRHARIVITPAAAMIEDLASSNGTFVDGRRLTSPHRLGEGDVIELGPATMTFRLWSDERPQKTERIARP